MPPQHQLSAADIKKKLVGYNAVTCQQLPNLKPGDRIRYMSNNEFRGGGAVKTNRYPSYIVLVNVMTNVSWCMQLKDPTLKVWVKSLEKVTEERADMQRVYQLYKEGKLSKKK